MDDLSSLDWSSKAPTAQAPRPSNSTYQSPLIRSAFGQPSLTPQPLSRPGSTLSGSSIKSVSPANDSFSNLLATSATNKAKATLTLQDRQRQLLEERARQIQEQQQRQAKESHLWETIGSSTARAPSSQSLASNGSARGLSDDTDDILAAFNKDAKVDRSTNFPPPPSAEASGRGTPAGTGINGYQNGSAMAVPDDDDDPFGLGAMPKAPARYEPSRSAPVDDDDDDILGDLSKPPPARAPTPPRRASPASKEQALSPHDRQLAELVDMGFSAVRAQAALEATDDDLQGAVSWLLNQAHAVSHSRSQGGSTERRSSPVKSHRAATSRGDPSMRGAAEPETQARRRTDAGGEKDVSQYATEVGSALFKSANSLWKAGRKQVQKAVADLQQEDGDASQPKWMRDTGSESRKPTGPQHSTHNGPSAQRASRGQAENITNEALLLEGGGRPEKQIKSAARLPHEPPVNSPLRGRSPAQVLPERSAPPRQPPTQQRQPATSASRLNRDQIEAQASQAYVSSARRRKPTAKETPKEPEVDLFSPAPAVPAPRPAAPMVAPSAPSRPSAPSPVRQKAPPSRSIPPVSASALAQSAQHRAKGTEAFKRGDFDTAHQCYTSAASPIPPTHPVLIVVLSNRALTALRTGDPRLAIQDADTVLAIIGPAKGDDETIDLGAEGRKDMRDFYGKALTRKAEALEAMEKWAAAASAWQDLVAAGGGAGAVLAVRGRDRCLKAADPAAAAVKAPSRPAVPRKVEPARPKLGSGAAAAGGQEAVKKLRAQNAAAERLDDEKFALADGVAARVEAWKGGKSDNLRALLGSLENVLWDGAGWKKVGMAELVLVNKVKIVYMRAIAKVHPDKIGQDATTEQKMISANVFSVLNEAWDKFKADNGL